MKRPRRRRRILDATAARPRELTWERGPIPDRQPLRASVAEHCLARLGRLVARLDANDVDAVGRE